MLGLNHILGWLLSSRADRLANAYPMYGREMVRDYAIADMGMGHD